MLQPQSTPGWPHASYGARDSPCPGPSGGFPALVCLASLASLRFLGPRTGAGRYSESLGFCTARIILILRLQGPPRPLALSSGNPSRVPYRPAEFAAWTLKVVWRGKRKRQQFAALSATRFNLNRSLAEHAAFLWHLRWYLTHST